MTPPPPGSRQPHDSDPAEAESIEFEFEHVAVPEETPEPERPESKRKEGKQRRGGEDEGPVSPHPVLKGDRRWPGALAFLLLLPCIAGLIWLMLPVVFRVEAGIRFPYQLDAEEGFVYKQAIDLGKGRSIYPPIGEEPYVVGNYPPLYPAMTALVLKAGGEGLASARGVVAAAAVLIALLMVALAYALSRNGAVALLAPLLFLVSYEFYTWAPYARVDLPALALTLMGALAFIVSRTRPGLVFSALCFVAAAFTRQTAIGAPAACVVALIFTDRRRLGWFLLPYLGVGLGLFAVLNFMLEGQFWKHLVVYNRNAMDWAVLRRVLVNEVWFFYRWWIIGLAAATTVAIVGGLLFSPASEEEDEEEKDEDDRGRRRAVFAPVYFIVSVLSLAAFAKSGSAANYALEPLAATSLFSAFIFGRSIHQAREGTAGVRFAGAAGMVLFAALLLIHVGRMLPVDWKERLPAGETLQRVGSWLNERRVGWALFSSPNPGAEDLLQGDRIVALLGSTRGDVFSELPVFTMKAGKPVLIQPFIMSTLAREGQWDAAPFLEDLRRRRFGLMVTTQDLRTVRDGAVLARYTDAMAETILGNYELTEVLPPGSLRTTYYVWRPRADEPV